MSSQVDPITPQQAEYLRLSGNVEIYSLQSLVELIYVKHGNDLLSSAFTQLNAALEAAQGALATLTDLQNLHNQVGVQTKMPFSSVFDYKAGTTTYFVSYRSSSESFAAVIYTTLTVDSADSYRSAYNLIASGYYTPIDLTFQVTIPPTSSTPSITEVITSSSQSGYAYFRSNMLDAKGKLSAYITQLQGLTNAEQRSGVEPLVQRLLTVKNSLPGDTFISMKNWVIDGNNEHTAAGVQSAGVVQRDLGTAITASQSLNATQNQNVRKFMFEFQQYQQSAAAVLSALTQLYRSISSNISRT